MDAITLNVAMVGPTGVGKTSLLAAMYNEAKRAVTQCNCTFACEGPTKKSLHDRQLELQAIANGKKLKIANDVYITGTTEKREYDFQLSLPFQVDDDNIIDISFVDMPGGWFSGTGYYKKAQETLGESLVSFWCIDATALMEGDDGNGLGEYHEHINEPENVFDCYQKCVDAFTGYHHIHFVLMRAESYLRNTKDKNLLFRRFEEAYQILFEKIQSLCKGRNVELSGSYSAVQTVGNVYFYRWENEETGKPQAVFKRDANKRYSPDGCSAPIATAINWGLVKALNMLEDEHETSVSRFQNAVDKVQESESTDTGTKLGGAAAGAVAGAAIASVVPVIGTVTGAVIGGLLGAFGGMAARGDETERKQREATRLQRQSYELQDRLEKTQEVLENIIKLMDEDDNVQEL